MTKLLKTLHEIPVYPEYLRLKAINSNFPSEAPICEDKGRYSFISQEAKDNYLKEYKWRNE